MDKTGMSPGLPVAVMINQLQFAPGGSIVNSCVQSVMVLGCQDGRGTAIVNGQELLLSSGWLYILPWNHFIEYRADTKDPCLVYGMHIIPWHSAAHPITLAVPHETAHPLHNVPWRKATISGELPSQEIISSTEQERPALVALVRYGLELFRRSETVEAAVLLGRLGLQEIQIPPQSVTPQPSDLPAGLRTVTTWILQHIAETITSEDLERVAGVSQSTLTRMFHQELDTTPIQWIIERRIEVACVYLSSTSSGISLIARQVGFDDPYYFSRAFKARMGLSPREWRIGRGRRL